MTTQFVIRDDDLCFFTDPEELQSVYGDIWQSFPVTFAAVPWQKGAFAGHVPLKYWHTTDAFPIAENTDLVAFIRELISHDHVDIALHGIHHTYAIRRNRMIPELTEFPGNFRDELRRAKAYLDDVFGTDIDIFVPPSNTMSPRVASILISEGWSLLNWPGLRANTRPLFSWKHQSARLRRGLSFALDKHDMTSPLVWPARWELGGFALTPNTRLEQLKNALKHCVERGHPFVLATHYWEHASLSPQAGIGSQYDLLRAFLDYASSLDVTPVLAKDLRI